MSRPGITARREQIVTALRQAGRPLTVVDILKALGLKPTSQSYAYAIVYQDLRLLDKQGVVEWLDWTNPENPHRYHATVFRIVDTPSDGLSRSAVAADLEASWNLPAVDPRSSDA